MTRVNKRNACVTDLNLIDYEEAWKFQSCLVTARHQGRLPLDVCLLLEHYPVMTLGKRGGRENLIVPERFLENRQIPLIQVERGGDITYHGPGQLVVYVISDLDEQKCDVTTFVSMLEETVIRTLKNYGVRGDRLPLNRGVFVSGQKIGSVGLALRKGVTFHGLSLNVNLSLEPFSWINPCGLKDIRMTTIQNEIKEDVQMAEVKQIIKSHLEDVFSLSLHDKTRDDLETIAGFSGIKTASAKNEAAHA
ncbi:MAG: lipoyl(octanoyl) transferase LipB [Proteobacteria bacterium]|nr:lipoyl(octanoyl) transferase LipB [Pseudomonadota bacterium]